MVIGVPKEIKDGEFRVAVTPTGAATLSAHGHRLLVQAGAGQAAGMPDADYRTAGAEIAPDMPGVYRGADMVLKVKEILPPEYPLLRPELILFTYIHSANKPEQTQALLDSGAIAIAYEDVRTDAGEFPLLAPMSEIAGEVGVLMGTYHLFNTNGGPGVLPGGAPGVAPVKVVVLGAGHSGLAAARRAVALGAAVTVLDVNRDRLRDLRDRLLPGARALDSNPANLRRVLADVDLLINAVKWTPGLTLVSRPMLKTMKRGALIVDIDCEPGGAIETCAYTTHANPVYDVDGVRHLCIPNLPSAVAHTASQALCNATLPYALELADKGWLRAVKENAALRRGLGFAKGLLTFQPTAKAQNRPCVTPEEAIERLKNTEPPCAFSGSTSGR